MALILKSNSVYTGPELVKGLSTYIARVQADGGVVASPSSVASTLIFVNDIGLDEDRVLSATSANWGYKEQGGNIVKLYSLLGESGDVVLEGGNTLTQVNGVNFVHTDGGVDTKIYTQSAFNTLSPAIVMQYKFNNRDLSKSYAMTGYSSELSSTYRHIRAILTGQNLTIHSPSEHTLNPFVAPPNSMPVLLAGLTDEGMMLGESITNNIATYPSANISPTLVPASGCNFFLGSSNAGYRSSKLTGLLGESWCLSKITKDEMVRIGNSIS